MAVTSRTKSVKASRQEGLWDNVPPAAHVLLSSGQPKTREALKALFQRSNENSSLPLSSEDEPENPFWSQEFTTVVNGLKQKKWDDEQVAELLRHFKSLVSNSKRPNLGAFAKFIDAHPDKSMAQAVIDCVNVRPPTEIEIIKQLSKIGNQKVVYLGTWKSANQVVVVKQIKKIEQGFTAALSRETRNHPLSFKTLHPNIIQTHTVKNDLGETFLVERQLKTILSEDWRAAGVQEASALLFDLLSALVFIHTQELVHGDIKPDNIGVAETGFILMDFGSCHKFQDFEEDQSTAGSIRTQAPELLLGGHVVPSKIDIWSLGATIFYGMCGRYPFFKIGEDIPSVNLADQRENFKRDLVGRIQQKWHDFVSLGEIPSPLREIIRRMLEKDPNERPAASELILLAEKELLGYRIGRGMVPVVTAITLHEELDALESWISRAPGLNSFSNHRRQRIMLRLTDLLPDVAHGTNEEQRLQKLITILGRT